MLINKILLIDDCDNSFIDLIEFKRNTTKEEIYEIMYKCKNEIENYTSEDIHKYLDKYIGVKYIEFLDYMKIFY